MTSTLQRQLEVKSGRKLQVRINDNRSTMLSVRWEPKCAKVSLHRMFLQAPQNVMQELGHYLKGGEKGLTPSIRAFIEDNVRKLDYSHEIDHSKLLRNGFYYNLQSIYDELNREYFQGQLKLNITWFGRSRQLTGSRATLGLYQEALRLVKIHRILDSPTIPYYVVSFVVYHEMVHHVCPPYMDRDGLHRIHSKEFRERESKFRHYKLAQNWIDENHDILFA
jgi:hypothetical protein